MIIEFPAPAPLLNLNDRHHWSKRAEITKEWRRAGFLWGIKIGREQKWDMPLGPSTVKVTLPVKSLKTRRDPSNLMATVKPLVDGLTDAGYWGDDSSEFVTIIEPDVWTSGMVLVEINPRQP